jgi:hypothetical protein
MDNKSNNKGLFQYNENRIFNIWVHTGMAIKVCAAVGLLFWLWRTL